MDAESHTVICSSDESGLFGITPEGERITFAPVYAEFLGVHGLELYYGIRAENKMEFYSIRTDGLDEQKIGEVEIPNAAMGEISIGDALVEEEGIYLSCGIYGGTGMTFFGGGIYRIDYDGEVETLAEPRQAEVNFPKLYLKKNGEDAVLYFYTGDGYANAGFWDSWVSEDVYGIDLNDGTIHPETFTLSNIGDAVCMNGGVSTLMDESGEYTEILSADEAIQLGYTDLGGHSGEGETFVRYLDIVDDMAYFTITKITEDSSSSVGWRTGYRRDVMKTYATQIGSGEFELLYEY